MNYKYLIPRYLAEFATANDRKQAAEDSLVAYKAASDIAMTELAPTHPIRWAANSILILVPQNNFIMCKCNII